MAPFNECEARAPCGIEIFGEVSITVGTGVKNPQPNLDSLVK